MKVPQTTKNRTTFTPRYISGESEDTNLKSYLLPNVHSSIIYNSQDMEAMHNGILLSHKKNEILSFAITWMDLESIILSEINQTEKVKYSMSSFICRI